MEFSSVEFVYEITFSKYCKFWLQRWRHQFKIGSKEPKLVSHAPMVIERWQSKVKGAFRWSIRIWNYFLEILKSKPHVVTSSSQDWFKETQFIYHVRLAVKISKSGHIITWFIQKKFSDRRISESWNTNPRCEHNRKSILLIYSRANTALRDLVIVFLGTWILKLCL